MMPSLACARASAASKSRYFCTRFSSENTFRIASVVNMSRNTAESRIVAGIRALLYRPHVSVSCVPINKRRVERSGCATGHFGTKWCEFISQWEAPGMTMMSKPEKSFRLEPVHPKPEEAHTMPYAPAVRIVGACDLMFLSGATPSPLYHKHPHVDAEHVHPHSIEEQTKRAMEAIKSILDEVGAGWRDVIKVTKYLTDFRDADAMHATMGKYFGDWRPASTTVCINQLSSPGARVELDMIVALSKKTS